MKHKVSELTGGLLDAAVAKANGWPFDINPIGDGRFCYLTQGAESFCPSTSWATGGPIIDKHDIQLEGYGTSRCGEIRDDTKLWVSQWGETSLIAAMRAYVAWKLGEEVEL